VAEGLILLINDEDLISQYLRDTLFSSGYQVSSVNTVKKALELVRENSFDLIIAKFKMPELIGGQIIKEIRHIDSESVIIVLGEQPTLDTLQEVFSLGIYDYITKPINLEKLLFMTKKAVELHRVLTRHKRLLKGFEERNISLQRQNTLLAKRIEESTKNLTKLYDDLRSTYMRTIKALAQAIDARDHYTHSHSENVTSYAAIIAEEMQLSTKDIEIIREACQLHDIGKIGIQDCILTKPDKLTPDEWDELRLHPSKGAQILEPLTFLSEVVNLVRHHHERYDGKGYPDGLKGEEIPLGARIMALADAYDAMISARPYRQSPFNKQDAIVEIKNNSGSQFDPKVIEAFFKIVDKI
jgi:putative nucleotidyltransferase with HDIG domain